MNTTVPAPPRAGSHRVRSDVPFFAGLIILGGAYVLLLGSMLLADLSFTSPGHIMTTFRSPEIRYAVMLSLLSCSLTAILSLWVAIPIGYLLSRYRFRGKALVDSLLDIPIALPPLVIGLSLLILFRTSVGQVVEGSFARLTGSPFTYAIPGVVLAQFMVACAFAVRIMRATFDHIDPRQEHVALTLGCTRGQAFLGVVLPDALRGIITAGTLAWARALGEFGPILVFAGATRMRTEVMPTTVFLELSVGNIEAAVAISLLMIVAAVSVLVFVRIFGRGSILEGV